MSLKRCCFYLILIFSYLIYVEAGRGGGGFRISSSRGFDSRSSSSIGRYSSSRRATPAPSFSRNYASAAPTRSSRLSTDRATNRRTTPRYVIRPQPTVRTSHTYQSRSHPSQSYPSQSYPSQSYPSQRNPSPVYTTPRNVHLSPKSSYYPIQSYGGFNRPSYGGGYSSNYGHSYHSSSPYYTPSYSRYPNLYQPVGKYKEHSVRNSVIAGLGGSALGMYLGYKLGSFTNSLNRPIDGYGYNGGYGGGNGYSGFPTYSVVHHYHHGERTIPQTFEVKPNAVTQCGNDINFCSPNTSPICMTNGTIYCVAPISATSKCNETTLTNLPCLNTTISIPCVNASDPNCHNGVMLNEIVAIPCVSNISVYGDFTTNKLQVHSLSGNNSDTTLTGQGIKNNFCVTVIADPVKIPKRMTNNEFLWYLEDNPKENEVIRQKTSDVFQNMLNFMFY